MLEVLRIGSLVGPVIVATLFKNSLHLDDGKSLSWGYCYSVCGATFTILSRS